MTPLRSQISSAEYNIPTSGKLSGQTNNPTLAQTTLDTPEHHLPAQRKGKLLDTHNLKAKISVFIPQSAEDQSLHEISKHKLQANLLLTSRNPAANNCMRQNCTSFFC